MRWPMSCLGEVASLERKSLSPEEIETGTSYLGLEHIECGGRILGYQRVGAGELQSNKFIFDPGTLLYGKLRPYLAKICIPDREGCCSTDILPIRPSQKLNISYLKHVLLSKPYVDKANSLCSGANLPRISPSSLLGIEIPLPPLEEQRRIAAILDQAKNVENLAARQLLNLDELACSFFQKAIADARQQGSLNEQRLGDISLVAGQYGATCSSAPYDANLPRYVRITDVQDNGLLSPDMVSPAGPSAAWSSLGLDPGDLLFARSGATVGKSYMHTSEDGDCVFAGYLIRFRLDPSIAIPEFVYSFTRTEAYRSWIANTQRVVAQPNINAKQYASLTIPLPPLSDQEAYCATYRHIKKQSQVARKRLAHVLQLSQSISKSIIEDQVGAP